MAPVVAWHWNAWTPSSKLHRLPVKA
jgi:hypothetical protein